MDLWDPGRPFTWRDGERVIHFGRGASERALTAANGAFALLTTARGAAALPALARAAEAVHLVPDGHVDRLAGRLRSVVRGGVLVALGGGRVIDVAKALASADPPRRVIALPTTLSGAEMTAIHRLALGATPGRPRVRPAVVLTDPALLADLPLPVLAASAANAAAHAMEAPLTSRTNPLATLAARSAAGLLARGLDTSDHDALALGGLLAGWAMGAAGYGLHHVLVQTLAREAAVAHGPANAVLLPRTCAALVARLGAARVDPDGAVAALAAHGTRLTGVARLRDIGVARAELAALGATAADRPELTDTCPGMTAADVTRLYETAW